MRMLIAAATLALALTGAQSAAAEPGASPALAPDRSPPTRPPADGHSQALSVEEMESASGGQAIPVAVLTQQQLSGTTSGNTVNAGTLNSGAVNFGAGALDGFNGIGNFVVNTGANNTLQGAINISIVSAPAS